MTRVLLACWYTVVVSKLKAKVMTYITNVKQIM